MAILLSSSPFLRIRQVVYTMFTVNRNSSIKYGEVNSHKNTHTLANYAFNFEHPPPTFGKIIRRVQEFAPKYIEKNDGF